MDSLKSDAAADDTRWRAVVARDRRCDGALVYTVSSTGVFCRPSCPARRPKRTRARLFATPELARKAGFRPCLRCRPDAEAADVRLAKASARLIAKALLAPASDDVRPPTLAQLGAALGASPGHVQRMFKRDARISPKAFAGALRLDRFRDALARGTPVSSSLYYACYGALSRLYVEAALRLGMTPAALAKGGAGETIRYLITD